ncbi:MAG: response regulator, partial [Opitutaceae bacterium]|nr:response regulator [Verrucomicrobiales bacterium]
TEGQAGFYRIHEIKPDAILLDLMLPKIDGMDILKKIRAQKAFEKLPVIVFTNSYLPEMVGSAIKAGAQKVFHKATVAPREIVRAVNEALFPLATAKSGNTVFRRRGATGAAGTEAQLDAEFLQNAPKQLAALRLNLQTLVKCDDDKARVAQLNDLYRKIHSMTGGAGIAGLRNIAQMCAAIEALLKELSDKPANINASTLRTVAHSIDFLGVLLNAPPHSGEQPPISVLVVDDELLSRKAVITALAKSNLKPIAVSDPNIALGLVAENQFDVIVLDVGMPGMSGFELCEKIRTLPSYKNVPVIFVTNLSAFDSRAKSSMSGGNDFIAKPFLFMELNVKVLTHVLRSRIAVNETKKP